MLIENPIQKQRDRVKEAISQQITSKKKVCTANLILDDRGRILLLKRASTDSFHPSTWCLPGGGVESYETPLEGVERETQEETSYLNNKHYGIIGAYCEDLPDVKIYYFQSYLKLIPTILGDLAAFVILNNEEHDNFGWFNQDEIQDMDLILDLKDHINTILGWQNK